MKPLGRRLSPVFALLLFFVFSPAGLEIAHAAAHAVPGDSHLHAHEGKVHRHAHGAGHHQLLPDGTSMSALQDAAPAFVTAAAFATASVQAPPGGLPAENVSSRDDAP